MQLENKYLHLLLNSSIRFCFLFLLSFIFSSAFIVNAQKSQNGKPRSNKEQQGQPKTAAQSQETEPVIIFQADTGNTTETVPPETLSTDEKSNAESENIQKQLMHIRALTASRNLNAAVTELKTMYSSSTDPAVREVAQVMLMNVYIEQANSEAAFTLLSEAYEARKNAKDVARIYFAVAGQILNGARAHLERYRLYGLNINDPNLPTESVNDLNHLRNIVEKVVVQAKEITDANVKAWDGMALLEDAVRVRSGLARSQSDRAEWSKELDLARQRMADSSTRTTTVNNPNVSTNSSEINASEMIAKEYAKPVSTPPQIPTQTFTQTTSAQTPTQTSALTQSPIPTPTPMIIPISAPAKMEEVTNNEAKPTQVPEQKFVNATLSTESLDKNTINTTTATTDASTNLTSDVSPLKTETKEIEPKPEKNVVAKESSNETKAPTTVAPVAKNQAKQTELKQIEKTAGQHFVAPTKTANKSTVTTKQKTAAPQKEKDTAATQPTPSAEPEVIAVNSLMPYVEKQHPASYPDAAKDAKVEGIVLVELIIDENGNITNSRCKSGHILLRSGALESVKNWKFKPYVKNGKTSRMKGVISFSFML